MQYLSDRYVSVFKYKGIDICTLRIANPENGDELGYRIDSVAYAENVYDTMEKAMEAIDESIDRR